MVSTLVTMATGIQSLITIEIKTSIKINFDYFIKNLKVHGWLHYMHYKIGTQSTKYIT